MAIDPEIIPYSHSTTKNSANLIPKWLKFGALTIGVMIFVGLLKALFPLTLMGLIIGFIWKQSQKY